MSTAVSTATPRRLSVDAKLRIAIGILSVIGIGIGTYLTYTHYAKLNVLCLSSGGCETVQHSRWSKLDGIPVATLGLAGYIGIFISIWIRGELGRASGFGLALVGFLFSMYLTYREAFTIHAYCQWCLGSAAMHDGAGDPHHDPDASHRNRRAGRTQEETRGSGGAPAPDGGAPLVFARSPIADRRSPIALRAQRHRPPSRYTGIQGQ